MNVHSAPVASAHVAAGVPGALILGGAHGSLAIARSLGRRGIRVALVTNDHPIAGLSRYVLRRLSWKGPDHADALGELLVFAKAQGFGGAVLFAGGDPEMRFAARHCAELAQVFRLATPQWEQARWGHDKRLTYELAQSLGIAVPWSAYPCSREEAARIDCPFPVILKPTVHEERNAFTRAKAWRANDRAALLARYDAAAALVGPDRIVLQEVIPGRGECQFSFAAVCDRGVPLASLVARRTRQYPVDFGYTSTFVETVSQPEVEEAARQFLSAIAYTGLVEVEFKRDPRDGRCKILDVNMRAWTWIGLGAAAGVDFPYLAWQLACGTPVVPVRGRAGAAWVHVARDAAAAFALLCRGGLPARDYLRAWRGPRTLAAFASDDPLPGLAELPVTAFRVFTRGIARKPVESPSVPSF